MVGYAPTWTSGEGRAEATRRRTGRPTPPRLSAAEAGYDSFRVMKGIALGCALSIPVWVALGFAVSALVG